MKNLLLKVGIGVVLIGGLWAFIGVERIVGDHEIGVSWEPFIKHRPSLQVRFDNPVQNGLELTPVGELSASERAAFVEFCNIRFGETDVARCYALITDRRV